MNECDTVVTQADSVHGSFVFCSVSAESFLEKKTLDVFYVSFIRGINNRRAVLWRSDHDGTNRIKSQLETNITAEHQAQR